MGRRQRRHVAVFALRYFVLGGPRSGKGGGQLPVRGAAVPRRQLPRNRDRVQYPFSSTVTRIADDQVSVT